MPPSLTVPARLAGAIALGETTTIAFPQAATSPAEATPHEDAPGPREDIPSPANVPDASLRDSVPSPRDDRAPRPPRTFGGPAAGGGSLPTTDEIERHEDSPDPVLPAAAGELSQLSGLGERVRQAVQQSEDASSGPASSGGGSIIIYGDLHMPAVQHVQPSQDKTQPPLVRGGDQDQTPQAF